MWWLFLLMGIPALVYVGAALAGTISGPFPFSPWYQVFPAIAVALFLGPVEEFGWRGIALPLLQRRFSPFWAGLTIGVIWALWHIPSFLIGGTPQSAWSFGPYFIGLVTISVILTPFFNASRGSLLISALYHFQIMNPVFPDAQPWDTLIFLIAAAIIVWVNRRDMFQRGSGITDVLMPDDSAKLSQ
jgi:membrane protease YdiL (CAAX protease family)